MANFTYTFIMQADGEVKGLGEKNAANPEQSGQPNADNPTMPKNGLKNLVTLSTLSGIKNKVVNYTAGHVEMFIGSAHRQAQANDLMTLGGHVAAFAANPILGTVSFLGDLIGKSIESADNQRRETNRINYLKDRAGMISYSASRRR